MRKTMRARRERTRKRNVERMHVRERMNALSSANVRGLTRGPQSERERGGLGKEGGKEKKREGETERDRKCEIEKRRALLQREKA